MVEKGIRCNVIIEILGKPKEYVEQTLHKYIGQINERTTMKITKFKEAEAKEVDGLFTAYGELDITFDDVQTAIGFCFDYMPSSIEVLEPDQLEMDDRTITNFLCDLQARLHQLDMMVKNFKKENEFLKKNTYSLLKNQINVLLVAAPKGLAELSKLTGVGEKELEDFLGQLIEEGSLKKENEQYHIIKNGS